MVPGDLLRLVAGHCERLGLEYYVTGSMASTLYGRYRTTEDVDVVVELPSWKVRDFCAAFPAPEFYIDADLALECSRSGAMFNIVHVPSALKADIMPFKDTPFDNSRLSRRRRIQIDATTAAWFAAPEDVILKKLEFFREGGSDKHLSDIASMLQFSGHQIDRAYIEHWALRIGVTTQWEFVLRRVADAPRYEP